MIHDLKCWPEYFKAVKSGAKPFEYRKDDRGYEVGDILHLREYDPATLQYSGDEIDKTVTYVLPVVTYGAGNDERYVIMGLAPRPDWTPCAEGLPEEDGTYDVTLKSEFGRYYIEQFARFENGEWLTGSDTGIVIAWMPPLEPYNPDRKEDADHIVDANKKIDQVCPKCNSMAHYDPHFGCMICRQCGWMQEDGK